SDFIRIFRRVNTPKYRRRQLTALSKIVESAKSECSSSYPRFGLWESLTLKVTWQGYVSHGAVPGWSPGCTSGSPRLHKAAESGQDVVRSLKDKMNFIKVNRAAGFT